MSISPSESRFRGAHLGEATVLTDADREGIERICAHRGVRLHRRPLWDRLPSSAREQLRGKVVAARRR